MVSDRPYRRALTVADAKAELVAGQGSQFDAAVVTALLAELTEPHQQPVLVSAASAPEETAVEAARWPPSPGCHAARQHEPDRQPGRAARALDAVAAGVADTLGFENVVVNLYRPAWDDFIATTVHGAEALRTALLGSTYAWHNWESVVSERFRHGGAYLVYAGELD